MQNMLYDATPPGIVKVKTIWSAMQSTESKENKVCKAMFKV